MLTPVAFSTNNNADNLYYHQDMKSPNTRKFQKAIIKEVNNHIKRNHWGLIPRENVQKVEQDLPSVWAFKLNRDIKTKWIFKHNARLNIHI